MTPSSPGVKLTYDDFVPFPDDGPLPGVEIALSRVFKS